MQETEQPGHSPLFKMFKSFTNTIFSGFETAQAAYQEARALFSSQLSQEEFNAIFPRDTATMHDVERAVFAAKERYENRSQHSKIRKWLASCSKRVMYYGTIMDTLAQHHPEYVSLAWGALKFLFIVSQLLMKILE